MHSDTDAARTDISVPTNHRTHFHGNTLGNSRRQYMVAIVMVLLLEQFPGRHAHHSRRNEIFFQFLMCLDAERDFAPGTDQDDIRRLAIAIGKNVRTTLHAIGRGISRAVESR